MMVKNGCDISWSEDSNNDVGSRIRELAEAAELVCFNVFLHS
jgi:hypothetical protein